MELIVGEYLFRADIAEGCSGNVYHTVLGAECRRTGYGIGVIPENGLPTVQVLSVEQIDFPV